MKIVRMRVVAGHSTKCCPLIKVWELNQTTRYSYLPIQQLFDSSIREAARLFWRAAWLSLPKVAFRERDKLHLSYSTMPHFHVPKIHTNFASFSLMLCKESSRPQKSFLCIFLPLSYYPVLVWRLVSSHPPIEFPGSVIGLLSLMCFTCASWAPSTSSILALLCFPSVSHWLVVSSWVVQHSCFLSDLCPWPVSCISDVLPNRWNIYTVAWWFDLQVFDCFWTQPEPPESVNVLPLSTRCLTSCQQLYTPHSWCTRLITTWCSKS